jgi:UDP-N-acetylmuramate--alanine ligase
VLTDIYAAGEAPIAGITIEGVEAAVRRTGTSVRVVKSLDDLPGAVAAAARPNDLVITLGAGSIGSIADRILEELSHRANSPNTEGAGGWA